MSECKLALTLVSNGTSAPLNVTIKNAVIAGWTGRDPVARDKHIRELEELGIAPPASTPIYYRCSATRLTTAGAIESTGTESSGEVEFLLIQSGGKMYVGVGSDHTDRKVETYNITVSKQMCDKPMASEVWAMDDVVGHWDQLTMRSWAWIGGEKVLYQEGTVNGMLPVAELIQRGFNATVMPEDTAMMCGTFAAKGGIRPATRFEYEIEDPVLKRTIRHGYDVTELPVLG